MQRFSLLPKKPSDPKPFGPLTFLDQLESNMREAGCSKRSAAKFKKLFGNSDPERLYAQNIRADLEANGYAPESVKRHITRMDDFQKKCYRALKFQDDPPSRQLADLHTLDLGIINHNRLADLPSEIWQLTNLRRLSLYGHQLAALPSEIWQLANLQKLNLCANRLAPFPDEIRQLTNLQELDLSSNGLTALPNGIGQLTNLRRLWLRHNQFTTVPRVLLDLPATTEINLQNNPLPEAEIIAVREEINRRIEMGQAVPELILPPIAADGDGGGGGGDALRVAAAGGMNVHQQPLTDAFKRRLDELAEQFPNHLKGSIEEQRSEIKTIEAHLFDTFKRHAAHHPRYRPARKVAQTMFKKGYGQRAAYYNDFRYSSGHVLSYVVLAMVAQWTRTPVAQRDQARENGLNNLIDFLAAGTGFCDTRHIEEVLQMVGIPLSQHAQVNPDTIGAAPVGLSAEQIRDATFPVAKRTLRDIVRQSSALADDVLQDAFRTALTRAMHAEHPGVTQEQLNTYLDANILPMWATFKELAQNNFPI